MQWSPFAGVTRSAREYGNDGRGATMWRQSIAQEATEPSAIHPAAQNLIHYLGDFGARTVVRPPLFMESCYT